jgi:hypothetical protein
MNALGGFKKWGRDLNKSRIACPDAPAQKRIRQSLYVLFHPDILGLNRLCQADHLKTSIALRYGGFHG